MKTSVCIATYNGEKYISQQLKSILLQLSYTDEVVISDNNSTDLTQQIIKSFSDDRVKLYSYPNQTVVSNFENALKLANGDIIIISDQDDVWLDGKVDLIKRELNDHDLVLTDCKVVDDNLQLLHNSLFKLRYPKSGVFNNLVRNTYTGCCMAFNRKVLNSALPFPTDIPMHDWWIGLVAEMIGTVKFVDQPFILYRRHSLNASTLTNPSKYGYVKQFSMRWVLLKNLLKRFVF